MSAMYNKAIRMVHPDVNPHLKNAHELAVLVNKYKHDDQKLELFVNSWQKHGFDANLQHFINARVNPTARPQSITVSIRDKVKIPTNKKKMPYLEGIIIKIGRVTRGKLYGYHKITIVSENGQRWNYRCRTYDNITVTGRATVQEYHAANAKNTPVKQDRPTRYDFMKIGLSKNTKYWTWRLTKIFAIHEGQEYQVYKTGYIKVWLIIPGKKCFRVVNPNEITSTRRVKINE